MYRFGCVDAISIIRRDPQTREQQVLETHFLGYDEAGKAVFKGISPEGLSVFGLVGKISQAVSEPLEESDGNTSNAWWIIGLIIAVLAAFGLFWSFVFGTKRKRRNQEV